MNRSRSIMGVWTALAGMAICGVISLAKPPGAAPSDSIAGVWFEVLTSDIGYVETLC